MNFEGRVFCCWKCGSGSHIGDKCRDQNRTFEEVFAGLEEGESEGLVQPTWAAVVRSGNGETEEYRKRVKEVECRLTEENLRRQKEKKELERIQRLADEAEEKRKAEEDARRQFAIEEAEMYAQRVVKDAEQSDDELLHLAEAIEAQQQALGSVAVEGEGFVTSPPEIPAPQRDADELVNQTDSSEAQQQTKVSVAEEMEGIITEPPDHQGQVAEMDLIFGPGAHNLAIEYESQKLLPEEKDKTSVESTLSPKEARSRRRKRNKRNGKGSQGSSSPLDATKREGSEGVADVGNISVSPPSVVDSAIQQDSKKIRIEKEVDQGSSLQQDTPMDTQTLDSSIHHEKEDQGTGN